MCLVKHPAYQSLQFHLHNIQIRNTRTQLQSTLFNEPDFNRFVLQLAVFFG